jgi:hypothetical protein
MLVIWREITILLYRSALLCQTVVRIQNALCLQYVLYGGSFFLVCLNHDNRDKVRYAIGSVEETQIFWE